MPVTFDSIKLYASLNSAWVDLTGYMQISRGLNARWGIFGYEPTDILADIGELNFNLSNLGGLFYPDGGSALSGWGAGVKTKIVFTYAGIPYTRFLGYIPKDGIELQ